MFVSSEWEADVPKGKVVFGKKASKKKLPKNLITSSTHDVPIENCTEQAANGFPTKTGKRKNSNPIFTPSSPQNDVSLEQTTKSKKRKKKNKNPPGMFVRNSFAALTDSSRVSTNSETQDKGTKQSKNKSSGISKARNPSDNTETITKPKKWKNHTPNNAKLKKIKVMEKIDVSQSLDKPEQSLNLVGQVDSKNKIEGKESLPLKCTSDKTKGQVIKSKNRLKMILNKGLERNTVTASGNKLRERMLEKLKAAQFRYLNEKLYTSSGSEAQQLFQADPSAFQTYHEGYQLQLKKWPLNPLDVIVKSILKMPKSITIADMGCGEATLSKRVPQAVRSFDLVARAPGVEACDMAHTPLLAGSVDVAVYCLALMGTDLTQYLVEANRVLKQGGLLLIAEVESRFENVESFAADVGRLGFKLLKLDKAHQVFFFLEFRKMQSPPAKRAKHPSLTLKPCVYKRR